MELRDFQGQPDHGVSLKSFLLIIGRVLFAISQRFLVNLLNMELTVDESDRRLDVCSIQIEFRVFVSVNFPDYVRASFQIYMENWLVCLEVDRTLVKHRL